jgi:hypothetical protein
LKRLWLIGAGVAAAHLVAFYFFAGWHPLPKVPYIAPPNFSLGWAKFTDPGTKEKMVYQEFTVTTQLQKTQAGSEPAARATR